MATPTRPKPPHEQADRYAPWMPVAKSFLGLRELVGAELNPQVADFFRHTRFPREQVSAKTAWCGAFGSACIELVDLRSPRTARARDFLKYGVPLRHPVYGALLIFSRGISAATGHVAFCAQHDFRPGDAQVLALGGNQDNQVCIRPQPMAALLGVRWPAGAPLPPGAEPITEGVT